MARPSVELPPELDRRLRAHYRRAHGPEPGPDAGWSAVVARLGDQTRPPWWLGLAGLGPPAVAWALRLRAPLRRAALTAAAIGAGMALAVAGASTSGGPPRFLLGPDAPAHEPAAGPVILSIDPSPSPRHEPAPVEEATSARPATTNRRTAPPGREALGKLPPGPGPCVPPDQEQLIVTAVDATSVSLRTADGVWSGVLPFGPGLEVTLDGRSSTSSALRPGQTVGVSVETGACGVRRVRARSAAGG